MVIFLIHSTRSGSSTFIEFSRWSKVGFFDRLADGGRWLVDAESELHALDGTGESVMACLAVTLFLDSAFSYHIGGVIVLEVGGFELLDTPEKKNESLGSRVEV